MQIIWKKDFGILRFVRPLAKIEQRVIIPAVYAAVVFGGREAYEKAQQQLREKSKPLSKTMLFAAAITTTFTAAGCTPTRSLVTEFDNSGRIIRQTETSESVLKTVVNSTASKSVFIWEDGWSCYISVSAGTPEDPTPHGKLWMGKINKGVISLLPTQRGLSDMSELIRATRSELNVTSTEIRNNNL